MEENFTLTTSKVEGFQSTWEDPDAEKPTQSMGTETDTIKTVETGVNCDEAVLDVGTQTNIIHGLKALTPDEENKLGAWLKRILPQVEEELASGVTYVEPIHSIPTLRVIKHLVLDNQSTFLKEDTIEYVEKGVATWLSVGTQNAPVLATSVSGSVHSSWCDHSNIRVSIWVPNRTDPLRITWSDVKHIPVKSCIECLVVNPFSRDMFAAGTVSGDLYIWKYKHNDPEVIEEIFSGSSQRGGVIGMDWIKIISMTNDSALLTCHNDGFVVMWKVGHNTAVKDKLFQIQNYIKGEPYALTTICTINNSDFLLGTIEGQLLLCSTSNPKTFDEDKTIYDPVIVKFGKQKFSISRLQKLKYNGKECLASCDISGVVHLFGLDVMIMENREPLMVIQLPLPLNQKIICWDEMEFILCAAFNGEATVLRVKDSGKEIIENNLRGNGSCIEISNNRNWLVTGAYEGKFQIFRLERED